MEAYFTVKITSGEIGPITVIWAIENIMLRFYKHDVGSFCWCVIGQIQH